LLVFAVNDGGCGEVIAVVIEGPDEELIGGGVLPSELEACSGALNGDGIPRVELSFGVVGVVVSEFGVVSGIENVFVANESEGSVAFVF